MQLQSWWEAAPTFLLALISIGAIALVSTAGIRGSLLIRFALGGIGLLVSTGVAGVLAALLRMPFAWWQIMVIALLIGALTFAFPNTSGPTGEQRRFTVIVATSWGVSAAAIAIAAFAGIASPSQFSQTYDNNFHLSAIAHILDTRNASSLQLRTLIETSKTFSYYPSGWHSLVAALVQLSGTQTTVAINAIWFAIVAVVWLPGIGWLTTVIFPTAPRLQTAVGGILLAAAFGSFPYALLSWGTLYPTFFATAVLPATLAAGLLVLRIPGRTRLLWSGWFVLGCIAVAFAQPRALASAAILLALPVAWSVTQFARNQIHAGDAARRRFLRWSIVTVATLLLLAVIAGTYLWFRFDLAHRPIGEHLNGPQALAKMTISEAVWSSLTQSWLIGEGASVTAPSFLLAIVVCIGFFVAARQPSQRWLAASFVLTNVLFIAAVGSDSVLSKLLTGIWYKDSYRLSSLIPIIAVPLAVVGIQTVSQWFSAQLNQNRAHIAGRNTWLAGVSLFLSFLTLASSVVVMRGSGMTAAIGNTFRLDEINDGSAIVDLKQIDFYGRIAEIVPANEMVLGDPWDGSALTLLFGDRTPVFPHVNGQWDTDRLVLAYQLTEIGSNAAVCQALRNLNVHYIVSNPHTFGGGDPSGNHFSAIRDAVNEGHFTPVLSDGSNTLYRISECD